MFHNNVLSIDINTVLITGPPTVHMLSQRDILEGRNLSVTCKATPGNPSSTTFYWTKVDNPGFRHNGSTLHLPSIQRTSSGTYRCTAENNYNNKEKGTDSQSMDINVLCRSLIMMIKTKLWNILCLYFIGLMRSFSRFIRLNCVLLW